MLYISISGYIGALYCLVLLYVTCKEDLQVWRPVGKFLCVKAVVFFTWWQAIIIELWCATGPPVNLFSIDNNNNHNHGQELKVETSNSWTVNEISKGLQDYLICIEMFFASLAFSYAFSYKDYDNYKTRVSFIIYIMLLY
jgi:hypothetical protein